MEKFTTLRGIAAPLPLTSAMTHFPAAFEVRSKS